MTLDTLCGRNSTFIGCELVVVSGGGLTPSSNYTLAYDDGPPYDTGNDILIFTESSNASGGWALDLSEGLAFSRDHIWLHTGTSLTVASRIEQFASLSDALTWSGSGTCPPFGTAPVLTSAVGSDSVVALAWAAAVGCDARMTGATYSVHRALDSGFTISPTTLATGLTGLNYNDATAVNGTTYYYRVRSIITYTLSGTVDNTKATDFSNVLSATPQAAIAGINADGIRYRISDPLATAGPVSDGAILADEIRWRIDG